VKILYAIQGTGNGHIARAEDIIPELKAYGELDLFVSGAQADLQLKHPVKYRSKGLSFYFGKHGGVDLMKTAQRLFTMRSKTFRLKNTMSLLMILSRSALGPAGEKRFRVLH
jgi:hypothetical protein